MPYTVHTAAIITIIGVPTVLLLTAVAISERRATLRRRRHHRLVERRAWLDTLARAYEHDTDTADRARLARIDAERADLRRIAERDRAGAR